MSYKFGQLTQNFNIDEFACNDRANTPVPGKYILNTLHLAQNLQVLRDYLQSTIKVNSGYRTPLYNLKVGGVITSQHLKAKAADIVVSGRSPEEVYKSIEKLIDSGKMTEGGLGLYKNFVHYDVRGVKARW